MTIAAYSAGAQLANRLKTVFSASHSWMSWREIAEGAFREAANRKPAQPDDYPAAFTPESRVLWEEQEAQRQAKLRALYARGRELLDMREPLTPGERITGLGYAGMRAYEVAALEDLPVMLVEALRRSEGQHPDCGPRPNWRQRGVWLNDESELPFPGRSVGIWADDGASPAQKRRKVPMERATAIVEETAGRPETAEVLEDHDAYGEWCSAVSRKPFDAYKYESGVVSAPSHLGAWVPAMDRTRPKKDRPKALSARATGFLRANGYTMGGSERLSPAPPNRKGKGTAPNPDLGRFALVDSTGWKIEELKSLFTRGGQLTPEQRTAREQVAVPALIDIRRTGRARGVDLAAALEITDRSLRRIVRI